MIDPQKIVDDLAAASGGTWTALHIGNIHAIKRIQDSLAVIVNVEFGCLTAQWGDNCFEYVLAYLGHKVTWPNPNMSHAEATTAVLEFMLDESLPKAAQAELRKRQPHAGAHGAFSRILAAMRGKS